MWTWTCQCEKQISCLTGLPFMSWSTLCLRLQKTDSSEITEAGFLLDRCLSYHPPTVSKVSALLITSFICLSSSHLWDCHHQRNHTSRDTPNRDDKTADRALRLCTTGGSCLSSPTRTNLWAWKSGFRLAGNETCDASSTIQTSNVRRENNALLLTPRHVVATTS